MAIARIKSDQDLYPSQNAEITKTVSEVDNRFILANEFWSRQSPEYRKILTRMIDVEVLHFIRRDDGAFILDHDFEPGKLLVLRTDKPKIVCYTDAEITHKFRFTLSKLTFDDQSTAPKSDKTFKFISGPAATKRLLEQGFPSMKPEDLLIFEKVKSIVCVRFSTQAQCFIWKSALHFVSKSLDSNFKGYVPSLDEKYSEYLQTFKQDRIDKPYSLLYRLVPQDNSNAYVTILNAYIMNTRDPTSFTLECKFIVIDTSHGDIDYTINELYTHLDLEVWIEFRKYILDNFLMFFSSFKNLKATENKLHFNSKIPINPKTEFSYFVSKTRPDQKVLTHIPYILFSFKERKKILRTYKANYSIDELSLIIESKHNEVTRGRFNVKSYMEMINMQKLAIVIRIKLTVARKRLHVKNTHKRAGVKLKLVREQTRAKKNAAKEQFTSQLGQAYVATKMMNEKSDTKDRGCCSIF